MEKSNYELVGYVDVDSGTVHVGDPCYTATENYAENWPEFCDMLGSSGFDKKQVMTLDFENKPSKDGSKAVVVGTPFGDGSYPVYVRKDKDGKVLEMKVVFDEE